MTSAGGDQLPEQWLARTYLPMREPERLSRSQLAPGEILKAAEVPRLTAWIERVHQAFAPRFDPKHANALDVEWLLDKSRRLYLVQARPHLLRR